KAFRDADGRCYPRAEVDESKDPPALLADARPLSVTLERMSKSKKNGTGIDDAVARTSGDALRLAVLFIGPPDQDKEWTPTSLEGPWRFLLRAWRTVVGTDERPAALSDAPAHGPLETTLHKPI